MLQHSKGLELDPSAILGHVEEGIQAAIGVGVCTCPGNHLQQPVPSWKKYLTRGCCTDLAWQTGLHTGIATPLTGIMGHGDHPIGLCSQKAG